MRRQFGILILSIFVYLARGANAGNLADRDSSSKNSFFPSWQAENEGRERRLSQDLTRTLEQIPHVQKAIVHISLAPSGIWESKSLHSSASVIMYANIPSTIRKSDIKAIISGASVLLDEKDIRVFVYSSEAFSYSSHSKRQSISQSDTGASLKAAVVYTIFTVLGAALMLLMIGVRRWLLQRRGALRFDALSSGNRSTSLAGEE